MCVGGGVLGGVYVCEGRGNVCVCVRVCWGAGGCMYEGDVCVYAGGGGGGRCRCVCVYGGSMCVCGGGMYVCVGGWMYVCVGVYVCGGGCMYVCVGGLYVCGGGGYVFGGGGYVWGDVCVCVGGMCVCVGGLCVCVWGGGYVCVGECEVGGGGGGGYDVTSFKLIRQSQSGFFVHCNTNSHISCGVLQPKAIVVYHVYVHNY